MKRDLANDSAVFDYDGWSLAGGLLAMYAWRSYVWYIVLADR
jgi:hypothetical protein